MEMLILLCDPQRAYTLAEQFKKQLAGQAAMVIAWGSTHKLGTGFLALGWTGQAPAEFAQSLDNDPRFYEYVCYTINPPKR